MYTEPLRVHGSGPAFRNTTTQGFPCHTFVKLYWRMLQLCLSNTASLLVQRVLQSLVPMLFYIFFKFSKAKQQSAWHASFWSKKSLFPWVLFSEKEKKDTFARLEIIFLSMRSSFVTQWLDLSSNFSQVNPSVLTQNDNIMNKQVVFPFYIIKSFYLFNSYCES